MNTKFFSKKELPIFIGLFIIILICFLLTKNAPKGNILTAEIDGEVLFTEDLTKITTPKTQTIQGKNSVLLTVEISSHGALVKSSNCPDKTCVKTGLISSNGETSICLPAHFSMKVGSDKNSADAMTY